MSSAVSSRRIASRQVRGSGVLAPLCGSRSGRCAPTRSLLLDVSEGRRPAPPPALPSPLLTRKVHTCSNGFAAPALPPAPPPHSPCATSRRRTSRSSVRSCQGQGESRGCPKRNGGTACAVGGERGAHKEEKESSARSSRSTQRVGAATASAHLRDDALIHQAGGSLARGTWRAGVSACLAPRDARSHARTATARSRSEWTFPSGPINAQMGMKKSSA